MEHNLNNIFLDDFFYHSIPETSETCISSINMLTLMIIGLILAPR